MQKITIAGHLGRDPEERVNAQGLKVTNFTVATNRKRGEKLETYWWRVVIFGDRFDKMLAYLKKGSPVIVQGDFSLNKREDANGNEIQTCEIIADSISFSPFGRPDQSRTPETRETPKNTQAQFGEKYGFGAGEAGFAKGTNDFEAEAFSEEEPLPF
ncbi:MAG: single-stranded DNA-binding protein [Chlamydiales bacterium]